MWAGSSVDECVVAEILIRLGSGRSVTQCKLVCKGWNSLISTPYFIHRYNTFQKHRCSNPPSSSYVDAFTLVCQFDEPERAPCPIFALSSETTTTTTPDDNDTMGPTITTNVDDITHSLQSWVVDPHPKRVKTSCRDLLLLCNDFGRRGGTQYYVVNMLTLGWKKLPLEPEPSYSLGIRVGINYRDYISYSTALIIKEEEEDGRHSTLTGFKVVRIPFLHSRCALNKRMRRQWRFTVFDVHIFSSETNRWTEHTVDWYPFWLTHYLTNLPIVSHNGMLHWLNGHSLVSWNPFDSSSGPLSRSIKLPEQNLVAPSYWPPSNMDVKDGLTQDSLLGFGLSQDCLHVIIEHWGGERALRVWRLEEEEKKRDVPSWLLVHKVIVSADLPKAGIGRKGLKFGACHPNDKNVIGRCLMM